MIEIFSSSPAKAATAISSTVAIALLLIAGPSTADNAQQGDITFSRDVAPIFASNCVDCHRPGEVAPMSLLTYEDSRPWAKSIKKSVTAREMPPWGVNPAHGTFTNDMALGEDEIATVVAWVDQGAKRGDPADMPAMPASVDGWRLGEPDYIIELPEVYVAAETEDLFPNVNLTLDLAEDHWVQAIEFLPSEKSVVHHIVSNLGVFGMSEGSPDGSDDDAPPTSIFQQAAAAEGSEGFAIYVAGIQPTVYEEGTGREISKGQVMSFNMHYHASGYEVTDKTRIGLHWGKGELKKKVATVFAADSGFHCPPGDGNHEVKGLHIFDQDSQIISFNPHMHVRGKDFRYELVRPGGEREILLDIPRYDYNWQWIYYPTEPIRVAAGSRIEMTSHFDNSEGNPLNPDPTQDVYHRGPTFQEMSIGFMEFIPSEGVRANPTPPAQKIAQLLAEHPAQDAFRLSLFGFQMGMYLPRDSAEGKWYLVQDNTMLANSVRDVTWTGDSFTAESTMIMPDGGGISLFISGTVGEDGKVSGKLDMGGRPEKMDPAMYPAMVLPFMGNRVEASRDMAAN